VQEQDALLKLVHQTVDHYEAGRPVPWEFDPSVEFYQKLVGGIVGFKIELTRLEGKWKLSQNHPLERQQRVVEALGQSSDQNEQAIARLMAENLASK
jgi:transcriptional regulator